MKKRRNTFYDRDLVEPRTGDLSGAQLASRVRQAEARKARGLEPTWFDRAILELQRLRG